MKATFTGTPEATRRNLRNLNFKVPAQDIAEELVHIIERNIDNEVDPQGKGWEPLSPAYYRYIGGHRVPKPYRTMNFSHHLIDSFVASSRGNAAEVSNTAFYFNAHNKGFGALPQREMLPDVLPDTWVSEARQVVLDYLYEELS